jgi:hypothetical protein
MLMFGRILGSTIIAVALTHGAAFAQTQSTEPNEQSGTVQDNAQSSSPVLNGQAQSNDAAANEQSEPSASSQEPANTAANGQNNSADYSGSSASNSQTNGAPSNQVAANNPPIPQQIRNKLQNMGFTDVQVVPGSFIVSAKDKDGDPVSMIIGPHSTTLFSVITPDGANNQQAQR